MENKHDVTSLELISGTIEKFLFQNSENGYAVLLLTTKQLGVVTVTGTFVGLAAGQEVQLCGAWRMHQKFGKQFDVQTYTQVVPTSVIGLKKYLGSGLIKGIGKVYAEKLVDRFGTDVLKIIDEAPHRLKEVPGIGEKRIEQIALAWKDQREIARIIAFLQEKGLSTAFATKIYKQYKENSLAVLHENPYRLAEDIWGISFKTADSIAQKIGMHPYAPQRIVAGILFCISQATAYGHLYVELEDLKAQTLTLLELSAEEHGHLLKNAFYTLHNNEKIFIVKDAERHFITLTKYYHAEKNVADKIKFLIAQPLYHTVNLDLAYQALRLPNTYSIMLNEDQQKGILTALQHKITIITGGPGTGKTTLIKRFLELLDEERLTYKLAAPTGRAAKRIFEGTGKQATTLHRLLEFDVAFMGFKHNERNALKTDFLIIDEASMLDIFLANALLKAVAPSTHVIFLGDIDQLPSVGAGNFLRDCIASTVIPTIRLTEIFRQAQDSMIIVNAHTVNKGEFPQPPAPGQKRDFIFIKEQESTNFETHLKKVLFAELPRVGIQPTQAMVLCPMNRGGTGTQRVNHLLQTVFNPALKDGISYAGITYKIDDKVMQIKNNYDKLVFNGDIGVLTAIDQENKQFEVTFDERIVPYEFDEINEIVLAYAITIHKSQGSEYPAVIIPLFTEHFTLLQRNLVYTAITRAKKLCIIIGQVKALAMALKNNKSIARITFLQKFLQTL